MNDLKEHMQRDLESCLVLIVGIMILLGITAVVLAVGG